MKIRATPARPLLVTAATCILSILSILFILIAPSRILGIGKPCDASKNPELTPTEETNSGQIRVNPAKNEKFLNPGNRDAPRASEARQRLARGRAGWRLTVPR